MPIAMLFLAVLLLIVAGVIPTLPYGRELDYASGGLANALLTLVLLMLLLMRD